MIALYEEGKYVIKKYPSGGIRELIGQNLKGSFNIKYDHMGIVTNYDDSQGNWYDKNIMYFPFPYQDDSSINYISKYYHNDILTGFLINPFDFVKVNTQSWVRDGDLLCYLDCIILHNDNMYEIIGKTTIYDPQSFLPLHKYSVRKL